MIIKTKLNEGDEAWFWKGSNVEILHVKEISVRVTMNQFSVDVVKINYLLDHPTDVIWKSEGKVFKTRNSLMESL